MFGIDQDKNLIIQFPVFVAPYTQARLTLYQIETVSSPHTGHGQQSSILHTAQNK